MLGPVCAISAYREGCALQKEAVPGQRSTLNPSSLFELSVHVMLIQSAVKAMARRALGAAGGDGAPTVMTSGGAVPVPPRPS